LNKARVGKALQPHRNTISKDTGEVSEGEFAADDDIDDADYEDIASASRARPAKRARTSIATARANTDGRKGAYSDWWKKHGKNLPRPTNGAEFRAQIAEARRLGYYPEPQKDKPLSNSDESEDE
jgi:hypothetical protein